MLIERNLVSCHVHPMSLDSGATPEAFLKREIEIGSGAFACTDHGSLGAAKDVYTLAKKSNLIPIVGLEGYFRTENCSILTANGYKKNEKGAFVNSPKYQHITMHAIDYPAYLCMVKLLSAADARYDAHLELLEAKDKRHGGERKPLFNWEDLEELGSHNITFTSSCMIGIIKRHIKDNNDLKTAKQYLEKLLSIIKPGNFYVELNPHDTSQDYVKGVFITTSVGDKLKLHEGKKLLTDAGELNAEQLAKEWPSGKHKILKSIKDRSKWREGPELEIANVENIEGFFPNDPCDWAPNGDYEAGLNRVMKILARQYNIPIIVGTDAHYPNKTDKVVQDARLAQQGPWRFYDSYHIMSNQECFDHFKKTLDTKEDEFNFWVQNSHIWADRFKEFKFESKPSLPTKFYELEYQKYPWFVEGKKNNSLKYTLELIKKHGRMDWANKDYVDRLEIEIKLLHQNGTIDLLPYFMVAEEVCNFFKENKILTGVGRGSAGAVLLAYLLGITHLDPLKWELPLERFLTLDRISTGNLPDIDQDVPRDKRDLLVNQEDGFLKKRFGDHFAAISADTTLRLRNAVKDIARSFHGKVPGDVEMLTKQFLETPMGVKDLDFIMGYETDGEGWIQGSIEYDPALKEYIKKYPEDWEVVKKSLQLYRQKTRHPSAFVLADKPIGEFIPLTTISGVRCTAYTMKAVEAVGGIKNDYLGLNTLSDIDQCIRLIQRNQTIPEELTLNNKKVPGYRLVPFNGEFYDIWDLPEDQAVFEDIAQSRTETVFQLCTPAVQRWLSYFSDKKEDGNYGIDSISSIAVLTALDRPGPLDNYVKNPDTGQEHNMLVEYSRRNRGLEPSSDNPEILDQLVPETKGILVFQESVQSVYQKLSGCTGPEAENFRRDVSKKEKQKLEKVYSTFMEKALEKIGKDAAQRVWESIITFSAYGFCKAHAYEYAITAYACAFLKHYYPLEWWCAVLRNADKNEINENFWRYTGHLIDLPDIKLSDKEFEIKNNRIRAPLSLLKGIGPIAHDQINKYGPYANINDFCTKIEQHKLNTGTMVEVIKTRKDKANKVLDPETGKKVSKEVSYMVRELKKGHSAINRGVVYKLIICGAMDSLFPSEMHLGEQLVAYEQALADAANEIGQKLYLESGEVKKYKAVVPEPVDPKEWDVGPLKRYQMRKKILSSYGMDLRSYLPDNMTEWMTNRNIDLIDVNQLIAMQEDNNIVETVAVAAYIDDIELGKFTDKKTKVLKEKCKMLFDIEGNKFEFLKWSNRDNKVPELFHRGDLIGCIVIVILNRYKSGKNISVDDLIVVEQAIVEKTKD